VLFIEYDVTSESAILLVALVKAVGESGEDEQRRLDGSARASVAASP
jgi:hypothetical protein